MSSDGLRRHGSHAIHHVLHCPSHWDIWVLAMWLIYMTIVTALIALNKPKHSLLMQSALSRVFTSHPTVSRTRSVPRAFVAPVPTLPVFLDLPLLTGDETPHAPFIAVSAKPWPGSVAVWQAQEDDGYEFNKLVTACAVVGRTQTALKAARPGLWDRGPALRVKISSGTLSSATELSVLNGANAMAIRNGNSGDWEVFQFADATLVGPRTYELSLRLRGQAGTDGVMPLEWPVGSRIVLLDRALKQIDLAKSARGLARHYRIGVAGRSYNDPSVVHRIEAFDGVGLRPYAPCHISAKKSAGGDVRLRWTRRTRIEGDSWQSADVPLGEERELYHIRISSGSHVVREVEVSKTDWTYSSSDQAADDTSAGFIAEVAQISDRFGPGPYRRFGFA